MTITGIDARRLLPGKASSDNSSCWATTAATPRVDAASKALHGWCCPRAVVDQLLSPVNDYRPGL